MTGVDPLTVACPDCGSAAGLVCWSRDYGAIRTVAPHAGRHTAAREAVLGQRERAESAWLKLAAIWRDASEADRATILAIVKRRQAMPHGIDALERVLAYGAKVTGCEGVAAKWTAADCAEHLVDHAHRVIGDGENVRDQETGELDAAHAAARGVMVAQLVEGRK